MKALQEADAAILDHQKIWGEGGAVRYVSADLASRYCEQWRRFNVAICTGDAGQIEAHANGMVKALDAVDRAARAAGHQPPRPVLLKVTTPKGVEVVIVAEHSSELLRRTGAVFTEEELGRILDDAGADFAAAVKGIWPGATIKDVKRVGDAMKDGTNSQAPFDDPVPFGA